ncbi:hypothetical protein HAX54_041332, partial [Datura stramonium]|nr:hypothetical protein [Datura stramonium]
ITKKRASSSASRSKAFVGRSPARGTTRGVATIALPTDALIRLLNVLKALVANNSGLS